MIKSLEAQSARLAKVGFDLDNVATILARAQRTGAVMISAVEAHLEHLDGEVDRGGRRRRAYL